MKQQIILFALSAFCVCAFANTPDNHSIINIQNNLSAAINAQLSNYQNYIAPNSGYSSSCMSVDNYNQGGFNNGNLKTIGANAHSSLGGIADIDGSTPLPSNGCNLGADWQDRGAPATYQLNLTVMDGQKNEIFIINYNNYYCNGGVVPPRFDICHPENTCKLNYGVYPYSLTTGNNTVTLTPGASINTQDGKYKLTFNINNCSNDTPAVTYTIDYVAGLPKINVTMNDTTGLTPIVASYQAQSGTYDPGRSVNAGNFAYTIPPHTYSTNPEKFVAYTYKKAEINDSCQYNYLCSDPTTCNVYGTSANNNKMLNCSQKNTAATCSNGVCNTEFMLTLLPSIAVNINNSSDQPLSAQYTPATGRYFPNDPPPVSGNNLNFTYSVAPGTQTASAQVQYNTSQDSCVYKYSWNGTAWTVVASNASGNTLVNCENTALSCTNNGINCLVNFNISKFTSPVPRIITANFQNNSMLNSDAIMAAYDTTNQGIYNPALAANPPGNFTYSFPPTVSAEKNLVTYSSNGDMCTYNYNYDPAVGCTINMGNMDGNRLIYCQAEIIQSADKCAYNFIVNDVPKLSMTLLNNSGLSLSASYTGTGYYSPDPPPSPPENLDFTYSWPVNNLKETGSVTYTSGSDTCTYSYSWNQNQCLVVVQTAPDNKLMACAYTPLSADKCTGDFTINNRNGTPILYNIVINNKMFADLALGSSNSAANIIESGQSTTIPISVQANNTTTLTYYLLGLNNINPGCQFSITWDQNGNPMKTSAVQVGTSVDMQSTLTLNCVKPAWASNCASNPPSACNITASVGLPN